MASSKERRALHKPVATNPPKGITGRTERNQMYWKLQTAVWILPVSM